MEQPEDGEGVEGQTKGRTWSPHEDAALGLAFLEVNGESGPTGNNYRTSRWYSGTLISLML